MTPKEAIEILQSQLHLDCKADLAIKELRARIVAIEALEKQIPKKLVFYGDSDDGKILCPYCETDLYDDRECLFNNCPYCGQAINWDGLEEEE